jgi:hypothetical protein
MAHEERQKLGRLPALMSTASAAIRYACLHGFLAYKSCNSLLSIDRRTVKKSIRLVRLSAERLPSVLFLA